MKDFLLSKDYLYHSLWLGAVRPALVKLVESTENKLDDMALAGVDQLVDHFLKPVE